MAWPEFLAMAVIGFGTGLALWVNKPLRRETDLLQVEARMAAVAHLNAVAVEARPGTTGEANALSRDMARGGASFVEGLMGFLPPLDAREQQLKTLHGLAVDSGAELARVEYGHDKLEHLPARRMTMQLSVAAEYAGHRKFLHDLLVAMPNLAVDRVTMEKVPGHATRLHVRLETSLYYRDEVGVQR